MRLARVACDRESFASDAVAMIHESSLGGMGDTTRLAALREAAENGASSWNRLIHHQCENRRARLPDAHHASDSPHSPCAMPITESGRVAISQPAPEHLRASSC
jgi:hypothetical protein